MTYRAIAAIPNNEMKEIKKIKVCINLSNRIFLKNFSVMALILNLHKLGGTCYVLNLELLSNTVKSNGNYNDDTIYRREKNLQLAFFWPHASNSYKNISTLRLLA